jgi:hypothetical protein
MKTQSYWPQAKVFLYAQAAFLTDQFIGSIINKDDLSLSFSGKHNDYLQFEEVNNSQVKIIDVDKDHFAIELIKYLKNYSSDKLSTGKKTKPERALNHHGQLLLAVRRKYEKFGENPVIDATDIWGRIDDRDQSLMIFWEVILAAYIVDGYIDLVNIGYDGMYTDKNDEEHPLPFAEIRIRSGSLFYDAIQPPRLKKVSKIQENAHVFLEEQRIVCIKLDNGEKYQLARLQIGAAPCNLIQYLMANQNTDLDLDDIKENVSGFKAAHNLTEYIRACGFDRKLKKAFFPLMKGGKINFKADAILDDTLISELKNRK